MKTTTQFLFFSGKGGVGKTTMACATAVHHASAGKRTLIVTTDPASNLADVFQRPIGHRITPLGPANLWGMEIDPDRATEEYRERILAPFRTVMPEDVLRVMEEQFSSPCTTEIASFDRFVDFMGGEAGADGGAYDVIVFDTAPTGHTLRLLELPVDWSRHIEESAKGSGSTCIGPVASIQENKQKYDEATRLLADPQRTEFTFVLLPEATSVYETRRSIAELASIGIRNLSLIVNGTLPEEVCAHPFFRQRYRMQQGYLQAIEREFALPVRRIHQRDGEIQGLEGLRHVARDLFATDGRGGHFALGSAEEVAIGVNAPAPPDAVSLSDVIRPRAGLTKTVFFTGKGGVGKTVVSCAAAYGLAARGYRTLLLTTDPAAHIAQVLEREVDDRVRPVAGVPNLDAVVIDQEKAVAAYKARILEEARGRYSSDMLQALREELESPCTEEMAAFEQFMSYVDRQEYDVVVFDTAPTGHTLRLLQLPFDYGAQVGLMVSTTEQSAVVNAQAKARIDRITARLQDPGQSVFVFVVYPESTPVVEAHRAFQDLREAGIDAQAVVANQLLPAEACTNDYFRRRRSMQEKYLGEIQRRFGLPVAILPLFEAEIRGLEMVARAARALLEPAAFAAIAAAEGINADGKQTYGPVEVPAGGRHA